MNYIKTFAELGKDDAAIAGGKGASLGEMTQAGIPVPPGYVVLSEAFEHFLKATDLNVEIDAILKKVEKDEMRSVEHASEKIQSHILRAKMPEDIAVIIKDFFKQLDTEYVAVRSSATAEDSSSAAWAGQLDSFLNTSEATLLENVQRCWASLFTPRAIFYRFEKNLDTTKISVAVVVQKMVESEYSGIAFSVHPVTEDRNQLIIEAGFGLGEAIVSGQITPDSYVVGKTPRAILDANANTQTRALYRVEGGGNEWRDIPEPQASTQVLTEKQILELSELIIHIENHYGFPCDIEWAFEEGRFYIVQSRPITTLNSIAKITTDEKLERFVDSVKQKKWVPVVERPCCVLVRHLLLCGGKSNIYNEALGVDIPPIGDAILRDKVFYPIESIENTKAALQDLSDKYGHEKLLEISTSCARRADELYQYMESNSDNLVERLENFKILYSRLASYVFIVVFSEKLLEKQVENIVKEKAPKDYDYYFESLIYPRKYNQNTEELIEIIRLSESIKTEKLDINSDIVTNLLEKHADKFGWLGTRWMLEKDWGAQDIKLRVRRYVSGNINNEVEKILLPRKQAEVVTREFIERFNLTKKECSLIDLVKEFVFLRTFRTEAMAKAHAKLKPLLQDVSIKLQVDERDIAFLTIDEIQDSLKFQNDVNRKISQRKRGWYMFLWDDEIKIFANDDRKMIDQLNIFNTEVVVGDKISGQTAWKGVVSGVVRIVKDRKDIAKVKDGDVLVAVMTFPNYIPAMEKSSAFITDEGGVLCHAAIISRELKKPCIIGTKIATQVLKDGDLVEVDADNGVVRILEKSEKGIQKYKKEDYVLVFWVQGVSVFVTDIHLDVYRELEVLYMIENGMFKQYFTKVAYNKALEQGLAFYSSESAFDGYQKDLSVHCHTIKKFFETQIKGKDVLSDKEVSTFFEYTKKLCGDYRKMNIEYTDMAFSRKSENTTTEKNLAKVTVFKDEVRAVMNQVLFEADGYVARLFSALGRQFNISPSVLDNLTQSEILDLFDGKRPDELIVLKRQMAFVESYDLNGFHEGEAALQVIQSFKEEIIDTDTIFGTTANIGKCTGKVKIIPVDYSNFTKINSEIEKMQPGEILVAQTTAPELITACKKAGAIVTDIGGLMSHSAIVSREFGIPCIVGTKIATQVLKDGDLVEVDADNGVVRILESGS